MNTRKMKHKIKITLTLCTALFILGLTGCKKKEFSIRDLELPPTPPLHSDVKYGVVKSSYLRVAENPGEDGDSVIVLRRGDLVAIVSTVKREEELWAEIETEDYSGWVEKSYLEVYRTQPEARTASKILLDE